MAIGSTVTSWLPTVGTVVGLFISFAVTFSLVWFKGKRRARRDERPPQSEKLLRPPGYFAACKVEELAEKVVLILARATCAAVLFGLSFACLCLVFSALAHRAVTFRDLWGSPQFYQLVALTVVGLVAPVWCIWEFVWLSAAIDELRNWRFGMRGEQVVAEQLMNRELAAAGYVAFHDLPAEKGHKKWNVDHVVVGPAGVFVLETKTRPRRKAKWAQEEHMVLFDGKVLTFPWCYDAEAVRQVSYNVKWVRNYLGTYAPEGLVIQPIIVVPGWFVPTYDSRDGVEVMNAKFLVGFIKRAQSRYGTDELKHVRTRLDEGCRSLEF
jgi:hypothetical protein